VEEFRMKTSLRTAVAKQVAKQAPKPTPSKKMREAAEEVELSQVPAEKLALAKIFRAKVTTAWEGIHGTILDCQAQTLGQSSPRFSKDALAKLLKSKHFRWLEGDRGGEITIGC
jgi:hypothetical protein